MSVSVLRELTLRVRPPRAVFVRWPFGHALGEPFNRAQQRTIIHAAFTALYRASPGALIELPYRWRRERYAEPASWELGPAAA